MSEPRRRRVDVMHAVIDTIDAELAARHVAQA
jgi:hypothetical protein